MQSLRYDKFRDKISIRLENTSIEDLFIVDEAEINLFGSTTTLPKIARIVAISLSVSDKELLKMIRKQLKHLRDPKVSVDDVSFNDGKIEVTISYRKLAIPLSVSAQVGLSVNAYGGLTIDFIPLSGALGLIPIPFATIARQILDADERLTKYVVVKQDDSDTIFISPRISPKLTILLNSQELIISEGNLTLICKDKSAGHQNISSQINQAYPLPPFLTENSCRCNECSTHEKVTISADIDSEINEVESTDKDNNRSWYSGLSSMFSDLSKTSENLGSNDQCTASVEELYLQKNYSTALRKVRTTHVGYITRTSILFNDLSRNNEALKMVDQALDTFQRSIELSSMKAMILSSLDRDKEALKVEYINEQTIKLIEGKIAFTGKDLPVASKKFEEAFFIEPFNINIIENLACVIKQRKHRPLALKTLWSTALLLEPDYKKARMFLGCPKNRPNLPAEISPLTKEISEQGKWFGKGNEREHIKLASSIIAKISEKKPALYKGIKPQLPEGAIPVSDDVLSQLKALTSKVCSLTDSRVPEKFYTLENTLDISFYNESIAIAHSLIYPAPNPLLPLLLIHNSLISTDVPFSSHQALSSILTGLIKRTALESLKEPVDEDGIIGNFLSSKVKELAKAEDKADDEGVDLSWWIDDEVRQEIKTDCIKFVEARCCEEMVHKAVNNRIFAADRSLCLMTGDFYSTIQVVLAGKLRTQQIKNANKTGVLRYLAYFAKNSKENPVFGDLLERICSLTHFAIGIDNFSCDKTSLKEIPRL